MLEEPDGLAGLVRLRPGGPRLQDQVLAAEKAGHWGEALTLYEQALRNESAAGASQLPSQEAARLSSTRKGHLKCLLQMGHMEAALAQVDGWSQSSSGMQYSSTVQWLTLRRRLVEPMGASCTCQHLHMPM